MVGAPWFNGGKGGGYRMQPRYLGVTDCCGITVWVYREKHLCQIDTYNVVSLTQSDKILLVLHALSMKVFSVYILILNLVCCR